jgi:hypothetical protein
MSHRTISAPSVAVPRIAVSVAGRVAGAGLLLAMAWIHWHLYEIGFSGIHLIGPAFLANALLGCLAAVAVVLTPTRWLGLAAGASALLDAGTLGALVLSLTVGLFGFHETTSAALLPQTVIVEAVGTVVLAWLAWSHRAPVVAAVRRERARRR